MRHDTMLELKQLDPVPPRLTGAQIKNLTLASLGSILEWYEFMVFGFLTIVIARLFFPPEMPDAVKVLQTLAIFSIGYLLRPLSGAIVGHLGDKFGRKKLFLATVFGMAVPTLLIGLLPTYAQIGVAAPITLLLLRVIQGIAIAGEFASAAVFVTEHVPRTRVGAALGPMMAGTYIGWFLGAVTGTLLFTLLDPGSLESWGWRAAFIAGGLFGLLAVYLRRSLDETPLFQEISASVVKRREIPLLQLMQNNARAVLAVAGAGAYLGSMVLTVYFYMPALLQLQYHIPGKTVFNAVAVALLVLALMCLVWGRVADRIGASLVLSIGAVGVVTIVILFFFNIDDITQNPGQLMWWYMGFSAFLGSAVSVAMIGTMSFPTALRFSGFGFSYNIGIVISAFTPTVLAWLVLHFGSRSVPYFALGDGVLGILIAVFSGRLLRLQHEPSQRVMLG